MTERKFHKTIFTIEVLSEEEIPEQMGLEALTYAMNDGDYSGVFERGETKVLNGKEAADALLAQGSDPDFFQINENGDDIDED